MSFKIWRLSWKSRRRRWLMWLLDMVCTEHSVSIHTDRIIDYLDPDKRTTDLFLEFRIYRHIYRLGKGTHGLSFQFNVTQVDCDRHFLMPDFKYNIVSETYYGLPPDEYFEILKYRISRLDREDGHHGRWYVKKRRWDYQSTDD